jgi:hypothetical protein
MLGWQKQYKPLFDKLGYQINNETAFKHAITKPSKELEGSSGVYIGESILKAAVACLVVQHVEASNGKTEHLVRASS